MNGVTVLIENNVYTAEEILSVELHQHKGIYNRPTLYLNANTVDGNKNIHINAYDIVAGHHKDNEYTKRFLNLKFNVTDVDGDCIATYVGELADIEALLDVAVFLDHQCHPSGTIYVSIVRPGKCAQVFDYSEDTGMLTAPYTPAMDKIHPTILKSLEKVKANNGRIFVD